MAKKDKKPKKAKNSVKSKAAKASKPAKKADKRGKEKKAVAKASSPKKVEAVKKKAKVAATPTPSSKADIKKPRKDIDGEPYFNEEEDFEPIAVGFDDFKNKSQEEIEEIRQLLGDTSPDDEVEVALRDAEGRLYCKIRDCDELSTVEGYCRYHYIKMWKRIQLRKKILTDGKLEKYIEELTQRYPDKYIEMIRDDLKSEKKFLEAIQELEIEDANEESEMDDDQALIDEVRGISPTGDTDDDSF